LIQPNGNPTLGADIRRYVELVRIKFYKVCLLFEARFAAQRYDAVAVVVVQVVGEVLPPDAKTPMLIARDLDLWQVRDEFEESAETYLLSSPLSYSHDYTSRSRLTDRLLSGAARRRARYDNNG
jgi:hypothetical protein